MNGTVESAADFTHIGVYIDVNKMILELLMSSILYLEKLP